MTAALDRLTFDIAERLTERTVAVVDDYEAGDETATIECRRAVLEQIAHGMLRIKPSVAVRIEGTDLKAEPPEPPYGDSPVTAVDPDVLDVALDALPDTEAVTTTIAHHGQVVLKADGTAVIVAPVFEKDLPWPEYRQMDDQHLDVGDLA